MGVRYNMVVKTGEYEVSGEKKNNYQRIGRVMDGKKGGMFILLDALFVSNQLNGLANRERQNSIVVSCFEPDGDKGGKGGGSPARNGPVTDDDIPF